MAFPTRFSLMARFTSAARCPVSACPTTRRDNEEPGCGSERNPHSCRSQPNSFHSEVKSCHSVSSEESPFLHAVPAYTRCRSTASSRAQSGEVAHHHTRTPQLRLAAQAE